MLSRVVLPGEPHRSTSKRIVKQINVDKHVTPTPTSYDGANKRMLAKILANKQPPCKPMTEEQSYMTHVAAEN